MPKARDRKNYKGVVLKQVSKPSFLTMQMRTSSNEVREREYSPYSW